MAKKSDSIGSLDTYKEETFTYVYGLIIALPLILIYEAGVLLVQDYTWKNVGVLASNMIVMAFKRFGVEPYPVIPALIIMGTLFMLQYHSKKRWDIKWSNVTMVHAEYLFYAGLFFGATVWLLPGTIGFRVPQSIDVVLAMGAGVYEEFLFRLILVSLIMFRLDKVLKVDKDRRVIVAVVISALCFSGFHHILGEADFNWAEFLFRTGAGIYLGIIYLTRGYGLAAGTHAAYNLLVVVFTQVGSAGTA